MACSIMQECMNQYIRNDMQCLCILSCSCAVYSSWQCHLLFNITSINSNIFIQFNFGHTVARTASENCSLAAIYSGNVHTVKLGTRPNQKKDFYLGSSMQIQCMCTECEIQCCMFHCFLVKAVSHSTCTNISCYILTYIQLYHVFINQ